MRGLFTLVAALLLSPPMMAQTTSPPVATFHANGTFGNANAFTPTSTGFTEFFLNANRSGPTTDLGTTTFLNYDIFTLNFVNGFSFTDTFAFGQIPNTALKGDSTAHLQLSVDTSQVAGFQVTTCTFTFFPTFSVTCQSGPFGLVQVDWQQSNAFSQRLVSDNQLCFFQFCTDQAGNFDSNSAMTSGSIVGQAFSNASGFIGTQHNTTITITRNH